jgi:hypothetical protein
MPIILIIGAIIIAVGVGALVFLSPHTPAANTTSNNQVDIRVEDVDTMVVPDATMEDTPPTDDTTTAEPATSSNTFTTTTTYLTPARTEHAVGVTLTLTNGVVSDAAVTFDNRPLGQYSNDNQARFADTYKTQVVGKPLAGISLSRVGGASLTSRAFNEAVAQIALDAAAGV